MVTISEEQLAQVEYIIGQSMVGHHVLFDHADVRRVFSCPHPEPVSPDEAVGIESHIEKVMAQSTLGDKRAYLHNLQSLDPPTFEWVVRSYFSIVETNIYDQSVYLH